MDWKEKLLKLNGKMTREKWLLFLLAGVFLMLLSFPGGEKKRAEEEPMESVKQAAGTQEHGLDSRGSVIHSLLPPMKNVWRSGYGNCYGR